MRIFRPGTGHPVLYGLTAKQIAEWVGVTERTVRRWKRGEDPPAAALQIIELRSTGNLGVLFPEWDNWRIKGTTIVSPDQQTFTRGDILSLPFVRMQVEHLQSEQRLPRQADWISERYEPARDVSAL